MSRLEPIIGTEIIDDIRLGHTWYEFDIIKDFITERKPSWFVEIGVHEGGLAYSLIPLFPDMGYMGIEINCAIIRDKVKTLFQQKNKILLCESCFNYEVFSRISILPNKIVYCDGGYKSRELVIFKEACDKGDVIFAHDFSDGVRVVRGVTRDYWTPEVVLTDITCIEEDQTFVRLDEEIFKETRIVGWTKK